MTTKPIAHFIGPYSFLSNFYGAPFKADGITYPTNEHYFQAHKVLTIGRKHENLHFRRIVKAATPKEAKSLGRHVKIRPDWEEVRLEVMRQAVAYKFEQDELLGTRLMMTGEKELIEGNNYNDKYWGAACVERNGEHRHHGKNWLGWLLMAERAHLRATR